MSSVPSLDQQKPPFSTPCHAATIGLGITLLAGSIFLALAAHRVFPCKANLLNRLGLPVRVSAYGGTALLGSILSIVGLYLLHREAQTKAKPEAGASNATKQTLDMRYQRLGLFVEASEFLFPEQTKMGFGRLQERLGIESRELGVMPTSGEQYTLAELPGRLDPKFKGDSIFLLKLKPAQTLPDVLAITIVLEPIDSGMPAATILIIAPDSFGRWIQFDDNKLKYSDFPVTDTCTEQFFFIKGRLISHDLGADEDTEHSRRTDPRFVDNANAIKGVLQGEEGATLTDGQGQKWRLHRPVKE